MKFKYFLRGVGIGIIFSSIVFLVAYQGVAASKMTEEEIIKEAKELGMVEKEDLVGDLLTTQADTKNSKEENSASEEINSEENSEAEKQTEQATEGTTENTTEATTENNTETTAEEKVTITIEKGSTSYTVCQKLQELGLIEDAAEFDTYLVKNGYASRIRVGEHTLKKGMEYHDIAEAISDPS